MTQDFTPETRLLDLTDALLLDLDGTVYHGARPIESAVEAINRVGDQAECIYITNNASRAPQTVADALVGMGVQCTREDVLTSAQAGIGLLAQRIPAGSKVYVVGAQSLKDLATEAGFVVVDSADDNPEGVIQGFCMDIGWHELAEASLAIRHGATYIATNMDTTFPSERGLVVGNGAMIAALVAATGVTPESAGKPAGTMFSQAAQAVGATRPLGVGDRLNTDIAGAVAAQIPSLMVLTGVSGERELLAAPESQRPTYVAENMAALFVPPQWTTPGPKPGWSVTLTADGTLTLSSKESVPNAELSPARTEADAHDALLASLAAAWTPGAPTINTVRATDSKAQEVIDSWR